MAVWKFIKDLDLDLSGMTETEASKIISKLDPQEVADIIQSLREASKKNENLTKTLNLTVSILEFVVKKGLFG